MSQQSEFCLFVCLSCCCFGKIIVLMKKTICLVEISQRNRKLSCFFEHWNVPEGRSDLLFISVITRVSPATFNAKSLSLHTSIFFYLPNLPKANKFLRRKLFMPGKLVSKSRLERFCIVCLLSLHFHFCNKENNLFSNLWSYSRTIPVKICFWTHLFSLTHIFSESKE